MRIWKWELGVTDRQVLMMPIDAKVLTVQMQHGVPQLWALVDEADPKEPRQFATYGTGNPMPDDPGTYIATYQVHSGSLVFHVFELEITQ